MKKKKGFTWNPFTWKKKGLKSEGSCPYARVVSVCVLLWFIGCGYFSISKPMVGFYVADYL